MLAKILIYIKLSLFICLFFSAISLSLNDEEDNSREFLPPPKKSNFTVREKATFTNNAPFFLSSVGLLKVALSTGLEYPAEVIITQMQANRTGQTAKIIKDIYSSKGIPGFYQGLTPKVSSIVLRSYYQWPILIGMLPNIYRKYLPEVPYKDVAIKTMTGLTLGLSDAFLLTPFEAMKVGIITSDSKERRSLLSYIKTPKTLFKGSNAVFYGSTYSWINFLLIDHFVISYASRNSKDGVSDLLPWFFLTSGVLGLTETLITTPLMMLQTQYQKTKNPMDNSGIIRDMREVIKKGGAKSLYLGWRINLTYSFFISFFDLCLLHFVEKKQKDDLIFYEHGPN